MGEFASHERTHAQAHTSYARSPQADVVRTPAELAFDAVRASTREVQFLNTSIEAVRRAADANDVAAWKEARASLDRQLSVAEHVFESANARSHEASTEARVELSTCATALIDAKRVAATVTEAPRGWKPAARESEILAVLRAPIVGTAKAGNEQKEQALRVELAQLDSAESSALATRLRKADPTDPIVAEMARMIPERRARILTFLADARRRQAVMSGRGAAPPGARSTMLGAPVASGMPATMTEAGAMDLEKLAPVAPRMIEKTSEVDHDHPTSYESVNAAGQGRAGFLTGPQRGELNQQVRFRLGTVARNYSSALSILEVEQMIKKPDELGFFLTLLLGVAESLLTAYGGLAIKALRTPGAGKAAIQELDDGAAKVAATEATAFVATAPSAIEQAGKDAEKSMLSLTELQLNSLLKTSLSSGKKQVEAGLKSTTSNGTSTAKAASTDTAQAPVSSGVNPVTSSESSDAAEKTHSMSYIDQLKCEADIAFDHLDRDVGTVSDGVALAYLQAFEPSKHSEARYKDELRRKVQRYIASPVSKIGRSMDWEPAPLGSATHVEKEVRIVRVLVPGYGVRYAAQDSVFDGYLQDHPGHATRSGAYDSSSRALSLSEDATWTVDGKEQRRHETPLRADKVLNYIEPEFEQLAIRKQEMTWQKAIETYQLTFFSGKPQLVKIAGA